MLLWLKSFNTWQNPPVLVATMRIDFYGNVLSYPPFADTFRSNAITIRSMNRRELKDVIEKPANQMGVTFEPGLVDHILDDVKNQTGSLPLLEFVLTELWKQQTSLVLTQKAYETTITYDTTGQSTSRGFERTLASYADDVYQKFSYAEQAKIRRVFVQLVQSREGREDTKRLATEEELGNDSWNLVTKLKKAHLVLTNKNSKGDNTVEIVHEALIQHWGSLRQWIEADRVFRAWQEDLRGGMRQWKENNDESYLLRGTALVKAEELLRERPEDLDFESEFIKQSQDTEVVRRKSKTMIVKITITGWLATIVLGTVISTTLINNNLLYNEFVYCPQEQGRPGKRIKKENSEESVCFRNLITSGEIGIFLSSTNYHLNKGIEAFRKENSHEEIKQEHLLTAIKQKDYSEVVNIFQQVIRVKPTKKQDYREAITLFEQAVAADYSDPVPQIFLQNAKARDRSENLKSKKIKSTIIKLAVVTSIDYYEKAANDVFRGVVDAQKKFNEDKNRGKDHPLLEIVIANDENQPRASKEVAQTLIKNEEIVGVIGHHSSESTGVAQKEYKHEKIKMPVISSTSSSSKIGGEQFFRTIKGTDEAAKKYSDYIKNTLKYNKVVVFYDKDSEYSKDLTKDFENEFCKQNESCKQNKSNKQVEIEEKLKINLSLPSFNAKEITKILKKNGSNAVLVFTSVKTNSVAIEISKEIYEYNKKKENSMKIQMFGNMALSEQETIAKGGYYVDGIKVVRPCLASTVNSKYIKKATEEWTQGETAINWRHATSYDAAQAFIQAIKMIEKSKEITRENILGQLKSTSFLVSQDTSSGEPLKWGSSKDHPNESAKYCPAKIEKDKFGKTKFTDGF